METDLYVEDVIVPLIAIPKMDDGKFRFLGTGFYFDQSGHLLTCRHVVDGASENDRFCAYQIGKKRELELDIIRKSSKYDLALCKSEPPGLEKPWPFIDKPFINIGSNVEVYRYTYEPLGQNELPFRQRFMKGHVTGISRDLSYPDSFELNFPILFGMSGSPVIYHSPIEGENKKVTGIVGCAYGSRESEIVHHTVVSTEQYEEKVSRIIELGLCYIPIAIFTIFEGLDINIEVF